MTMERLPKHIADMVGIRLDGPTLAQELGAIPTGLHVLDGDDGVSTVKYGDLTLGWLNKIGLDRGGKTYRAMTSRGTVGHFYTMTTAKAWLMSEAI